MNAPLLGEGRYLLVVRRGDAALQFTLGHRRECMDTSMIDCCRLWGVGTVCQWGLGSYWWGIRMLSHINRACGAPIHWRRSVSSGEGC
jgi:hypothetical protein